MKIEAVTISVGYGDFLAETLPLLLPHVDELVVVTANEDKETQAVCRRWGVRCLKAALNLCDPARSFDKAKLINHGLNHLTRSEWLLHIDADVVLPPRFRQMLALVGLDPECIYGVDRVNVVGWDRWDQVRRDGHVQYEWGYLVHPPPRLPLGSRLVHQDYGGYVPIGFFQLWHSSQRKRYPSVQDGTAEHSDVMHGVEWDRRHRVLLPEVIALHLESEAAPMGANWQGRRTRRFGPETASAATPPPGHG